MSRWSLVLGGLVFWSLACTGAADSPPAPPAPPAPEAAAEAAPPLVLDALVGTSGDATALVDDDPATTWRPFGDPVGEGLLIRFTEPTLVGQLELVPCERTSKARLHLYLDGADTESTVPFRADQPATWGMPPLSEEVRSIFLELEEAEGPVCAASLRLVHPDGHPLRLAAPRTVPGKIEASSTLAPADAYAPAYLFDRRPDFGWVEGAEGLGIGERLTLRFDTEVEASALEIRNGYQRSEDHFEKNARVSELRLRVDGGEPVTLSVADEQGAQRVPLPHPLRGKRWELEITGAIPGTRYQDLVLSELRLVDDEGPFGLRTADLAMRQKDLLKRLSGQPLAGVVDRHLVSLCRSGADGSGSFKLRSNQSFVGYEEHSGPVGRDSEVFDGAWVPTALGSPWSTLQLYGRRHRIATEWRPYGGDTEVEDTRISGGTVEVARVEDLGAEGLAALLAHDLPLDCPDYPTLVHRHAVVVKGAALADVLGDPS